MIDRPLTELIPVFCQHLRSQHRSDWTVVAYESHLKHLAAWRQERSGQPLRAAEMTEALAAEYLETRPVAYANRARSALTAFARWLAAETTQPPALSLRRIGIETGPLSQADQQRLLETVLIRYRLMVALLLNGLTVAEACALEAGAVDLEGRQVTIGDRRIPLLEPAFILFGEWLAARDSRSSQWVFPGDHAGRPMTERAVQKMLLALARKSGLPCNPRALRLTSFENFRAAGYENRVIDAFLGVRRLGN